MDGTLPQPGPRGQWNEQDDQLRRDYDTAYGREEIGQFPGLIPVPFSRRRAARV